MMHWRANSFLNIRAAQRLNPLMAQSLSRPVKPRNVFNVHPKKQKIEFYLKLSCQETTMLI